MRMLFNSKDIRQAYKFFIGKQIISSFISLGSVILIARPLGPAIYGAFFIYISVMEFFAQLCQLGINPLLYKESDARFPSQLNTFFCGSLGISFVVSILIFWGVVLLPQDLINFSKAGKYLFLSLPLLVFINTLKIPLEKHLQSKKIIRAEITAHFTFLIFGSLLVFQGRGLYALLGAWLAQNILLALLFFKISPLRPHFQFELSAFKKMLVNGLPTLGINLMPRAEGLLLSTLTSLKLGVSSTGEIGLTKKIIDRASFLQIPNMKVSTIICGNHIEDLTHLREFTSKNLFWSTLTFGLIFLGISWTPDFVFESLLGPQWRASRTVLPWMCLSAFISSSSFVLQAVLMMLEAHQIRFFNALMSLIILSAMAFALLPKYGIQGWGVAEASSKVSYLILLFYVRRKLGAFKVSNILLMGFVFYILIAARTLT